MILAEPPPSEGDLHFTLLGFPVRIHWLFWLVSAFLGYSKDLTLVLLWVLAVLVCILLHELGHAIVMRYYGYRPSIVLYSFGGLAIPHPGPYTGRRPGPWGNMLIAFAGPASGFILAGVVVLGFHYLGGCEFTIFQSSWRDVVPLVEIRNLYLFFFVHFVLYISVFWGLVNLLPIYPLDGGQIAEQVFTLTNPQDAIRPTLILAVTVGGILTAVFFVQAMNEIMAIRIRPADGMNLLSNLQGFYTPAFFGYLTFTNYETLQSYRIRGGW